MNDMQFQQQQRLTEFQINASTRMRPVILTARGIISALERNLPTTHDAQLAMLFTDVHKEMRAAGLDPIPWLRDIWTAGYGLNHQYGQHRTEVGPWCSTSAYNGASVRWAGAHDGSSSGLL